MHVSVDPVVHASAELHPNSATHVVPSDFGHAFSPLEQLHGVDRMLNFLVAGLDVVCLKLDLH